MRHAIRNQQLEPKMTSIMRLKCASRLMFLFVLHIYTWEAIAQVVGEERMKRGRSGANPSAAIAQCMPKPRPRRQGRTMAARPAATLLERLREVVIKLVMFSAISRPRRWASAGSGSRERQQCCNHEDPRRSEAVEDCIEFLRMSSSTERPTKS